MVNYRPISLTCLLTKVLKKIVCFSVLEQNQVLCDNQFGFRKSRSTTSLLLAAVDDWAKSLNSHHSVHCLFLDFSKAFNSVPHEKLLLKLRLYGVGGPLLNWFRCFLTTRRQRVALNGLYFLLGCL